MSVPQRLPAKQLESHLQLEFSRPYDALAYWRSPEKPLLSCGVMGSTFAMRPPGRKPDVMLKPAGLGSFPALTAWALTSCYVSMTQTGEDADPVTIHISFRLQAVVERRALQRTWLASASPSRDISWNVATQSS